MRSALVATTCLLLVVIPCAAQDPQPIQTKIYKSTDEDGNTVFSSIPTPDAQQVKLQPTNSADSVEVRPPAPREDKPATSSTDTRAPVPDSPVVIGGDNNDYVYGPDGIRAEKLRERAGSGSDRPKAEHLPAPVKPVSPRRAGAGRR